MFALRDERGSFWARAALALTAALLALLCLEVLVWHPGYAHGDESDVICFLQRVREGMPWHWVLGNGSLHKSLLLLAMMRWPGSLWVTSLPGLLALPVEAALLFVLARRLAGPRAGFFAVVVGLGSAFTLIRARAGLSLSLFPVEWLGLVWIRAYCRRPWAWALWGVALGLCFFDYEAWLPMALLFFLLPFLGPVSRRQQAWEGAGLLCLLLIALPWQDLVGEFQRRRNASLFLQDPSSASAGWRGAWGLFWGGSSLPYMAPQGHGVWPFWTLFFLPAGFKHWGRRAWVPMAYLACGVALVLAGGAPYGLPAHRFIAAWPTLALLTGLGLDDFVETLQGARAGWLFGIALSLAVGSQLLYWRETAGQMDAGFRGPVRNLHAAAVAGWAESQRTGWPLVTELHPLKGPQFRYMVGHPLPLPDQNASKVVAFLPWEYLPAVRGSKLDVATFQEEGGYAPGLLGVLEGKQAQQAVEAERAIRPLLGSAQLFTPTSREKVGAWLAQNPRAGSWARTEALDYTGYVDWHLGRYQEADILALRAVKLASARPLLLAAQATRVSLPPFSLETLRWARQVDPNNGQTLSLMEPLLRSLGHRAEADSIHAQIDAGLAQGTLLWD